MSGTNGTAARRMDAQDVKTSAVGRWSAILPMICPELSAAIDADGRHVRCPLPDHEDNRPSFRISDGRQGKAICSCGSYDGFELVKILRGCDFTTAKELIADQVHLTPTPSKNGHRNNTTKGTAYPSAREAIASLDQFMERKEQANRVGQWAYTDASGDPVAVVVRYDAPISEGQKQSKSFRPVSIHDDGWRWRDPPGEWPLYNLVELAGDNIVVVVEGEKSADAASSIGLTATTSAHGSKSPHKSDWSPLAGRNVVILPDNDQAGRTYAVAVAGVLLTLSPPATVKLVELPNLPETGDIADWIDGQGDAAEPDDIRDQVIGFADSTSPSVIDEVKDVSSAEDGQVNQSEKLMRLALREYRIGQTDKGEPFAVRLDGPNLAIMFRGSKNALRATLANRFRAQFGTTPNSSALADAMTTLQGVAQDSPRESVALRIIEHDGSILIDLGDESGRVVEVLPGSWRILDRSPVLFRRTNLTSKMPLPEPDGRLDELRSMFNVDDDCWQLLRGFLVSSLIPSIPHPILMLGGQQGAGKSTLAQRVMALIDPSPAPLRSQPRDAENWAVAASGSWVDNVSAIPCWWSDALCKAVTGDGWVSRARYTDSDLSVLSFRRVVILTSIDPGALRGDLGDRLLLIDLNKIDDRSRLAEAAMVSHFQATLPRLLGALLNDLAIAWERLPSVNLDEKPRMADFANVLAAIDGEDGHTLRSYLGQRERIAEDVIEADPVALAIKNMVNPGERRVATPAELLDELRPEKGWKELGWPKSPRGMSSRLKRAQPALEQIGIEMENDTNARPRTWTLQFHWGGTVLTVGPTENTKNPED